MAPPEYKRGYLEGHADGVKVVGLRDCPHAENGAIRQGWIDGFLDRRTDESLGDIWKQWGISSMTEDRGIIR